MNRSRPETKPLALLLGRLGCDWQFWLSGFCVILVTFGMVWALVLRRTLEDISPFFRLLASQSGLSSKDLEGVVFGGPGKMLRTLIGGDRISLENAMDVLSIALVHPLAVGLLGLWAIGRGTSLLGELDRGTLELLLSQPVTRRIVNLSQVIFDFICWPVLGLCLCGGLAIGTWWISPIREKPVNGDILEKIEASKPWWMRFEFLNQKPQKTERPFSDRMQLSPPVFLKAAPGVAALGFAMSGISFAIASFGRSRIKVLGILATMFFLMYLANLLAQLFEPMEWVRPLTVFYYYHPQELALGQGDFIRLREWGLDQPRVSALGVLLLIGLFGYGLGSWYMAKRDLPVPL